jgi:hypothetical protein
MREKITFGSDPEFMLRDEKGNLRSAIGVVPGTTDNRHKIGYNTYFYDNVLAECTIKPGNNILSVHENFRNAFKNYIKIVDPLKLCCESFVIYPEEELKHKSAREAACKDEKCCYTYAQIAPPKTEIAFGPYRSAGGHIHIGSSGWVKKESKIEGIVYQIGRYDACKMLDIFVGLPSVIMDRDLNSNLRKEFYGSAGRYRSTYYGIEYRTLGNFWLKSPKLVRYIHRMTELAMFYLNEPSFRNKLWTYSEDKIKDHGPLGAYKLKYNVNAVRKAINECNVGLAKQLMKDIKGILGWDEYDDGLFLEADLSRGEYNSDKFSFYKEWNL